jgi:hypothetical protein
LNSERFGAGLNRKNRISLTLYYYGLCFPKILLP